MRQSAAVRVKQTHGVDIDWDNTSLYDLTDIEARLNTVARIKREHGLSFDWRKASLYELTDTESRLNTVKRITRDHEITFDWQKSTLLQLTDAESRMNAAKRITARSNMAIDWTQYSLEALLQMETSLNQTQTESAPSTLSFDLIFPPGSQKAMGLNKLTQAERDALSSHVEQLLTSVSEAAIASQLGGSTLSSQASVIETRIDGDFEGWEGDTIVKLMNGQIWQQTDYHYEYHYSFMPEVFIYRSAGGWKMKVDGLRRAVGVQQLK
jgi:hypothetical protein